MQTRHPPGLRTLFFTEMWERFSYYGMRAILMLFMLAPAAAGGLGYDKSHAGIVYAMYTSLVYLMSIPGGWLADSFFGLRKSVLYGGIIIMIGHILLAMHGEVNFYAGLGCVILGTGLLKPNISAIVGQLYERGDTRREAGFSFFYMGINLGAFISPIVCGFLAQNTWFQVKLRDWGMDPANSWHWGFGAAAVGMFLGLVQYVLTGKRMGEAGLRPAPVRDPADGARRRRVLMTCAGAVVALAVAAFFIAKSRPDLVNEDNIKLSYAVLLLAIIVVFFVRLFGAGEWTRGERNRLLVISVLFAGAAVFWGVFEQAGSTLTIFADESTRNEAFGKAFPSSWWQSVNAVLIILLAPVFAWLWTRLGPRNPSYPTKFGIGLAFVGLGCFVLVVGAREWTSIWRDYLAQHKTSIVALAQEHKVKLPENHDDIRVGVVAKIVSNASAAVEESLWAKFNERDWDGMRAVAGKYGVTLRAGDLTSGDITETVEHAHKKIHDEILPPWRRVSWIWLFLTYLLHTIGELCLSPVGLAAMTRLAPLRVTGSMMGLWFLGSSVGNFLAGSVAGVYDKFELPTLLATVGTSAVAFGLVMFALVRPIKRMLAVAEAEGPRGDGH